MFSKLPYASNSTTAGHQRQGQPWGLQGGILVGFLHLLHGGHAVLQLLQRRVYAGRHIFRLLHDEGVFDQAGEVEVFVTTSPAGMVQFMPVGLGGGLQGVRLVTVLEMLVVCQRVRSSGTVEAIAVKHTRQGTRVNVQACVRTRSGAASHFVRFRGVRRRCPGSSPPALPGWASFWLPVSRCRCPGHRRGQCPGWQAARRPWRGFGAAVGAAGEDGVVGGRREQVCCRTLMWSREMMHGESTQALKAGTATNKTGSCGGHREPRLLCGLLGGRSNEQRARSSEDRQTRSDCHSARMVPESKQGGRTGTKVQR